MPCAFRPGLTSPLLLVSLRASFVAYLSPYFAPGIPPFRPIGISYCFSFFFFHKFSYPSAFVVFLVKFVYLFVDLSLRFVGLRDLFRITCLSVLLFGSSSCLPYKPLGCSVG